MLQEVIEGLDVTCTFAIHVDGSAEQHECDEGLARGQLTRQPRC